MKNNPMTGAKLLLLLVSLVALSILIKALLGSEALALGGTSQSPAVQVAAGEAGQITGNFGGSIKLNGVATGVYSDSLTLAANQPEMGSVDLALQLTQTGNVVNGYIALDKTLIFTAEHTLAGQSPLLIGPYVNGTFDGTTLTLQSERVAGQVNGRPITRQFRLIGTLAADTVTVTGEYRETLWGYAPQPITTIGEFSLKRPNYGRAAAIPVSSPTPIPPAPNSAASGRTVYLPVVRR